MAAFRLLVATLAMPLRVAAAPPNACTTHVGVRLNNTDYADGDGPRTATNAAHCCQQCITAKNCAAWSFQVDEKGFPGVKDCKWAHLTYCWFAPSH